MVVNSCPYQKCARGQVQPNRQQRGGGDGEPQGKGRRRLKERVGGGNQRGAAGLGSNPAGGLRLQSCLGRVRKQRGQRDALGEKGGKPPGETGSMQSCRMPVMALAEEGGVRGGQSRAVAG